MPKCNMSPPHENAAFVSHQFRRQCRDRDTGAANLASGPKDRTPVRRLAFARLVPAIRSHRPLHLDVVTVIFPPYSFAACPLEPVEPLQPDLTAGICDAYEVLGFAKRLAEQVAGIELVGQIGTDQCHLPRRIGREQAQRRIEKRIGLGSRIRLTIDVWSAGVGGDVCRHAQSVRPRQRRLIVGSKMYLHWRSTKTCAGEVLSPSGAGLSRVTGGIWIAAESVPYISHKAVDRPVTRQLVVRIEVNALIDGARSVANGKARRRNVIRRNLNVRIVVAIDSDIAAEPTFKSATLDSDFPAPVLFRRIGEVCDNLALR